MPFSVRPFSSFTVQSLVTIAILYLAYTPVHAGLCMPPDVQKNSPDHYNVITEFRCKKPHVRIPETAFGQPYVLTETEKK